MADEVKKGEVKATAPTTAAKPADAPAATKPKMNVFTEDSWMYHKEQVPKMFKKGDEIPGPEWSHRNSFGWYRDQANHFHWRKK